ncbi:MAG: hypothetical protein ACLP1X_11065 [Polyangiaceae bacterium]|jgi:hypothetical protein
MTPADAEYMKGVREKIAGYPRLAREALQRGEYDSAEEHWRLWREAIDELLKHLDAAPGDINTSRR